ncbi:hypothetical protein SAMN05444162_1995 [Paenibacillaceae bacterium GAS479]|nr:hypothetical protein SAMN05444162_1995 [Paenibacillaceae bacterium GAS479]
MVLNGLSDFNFSGITVVAKTIHTDLIRVEVTKDKHKLIFSLEVLPETFLRSNGILSQFKVPNILRYTRFKVMDDKLSSVELLDAALTITGAYFWIVLIESDYLINKFNDIPSGLAVFSHRTIELLDSDLSAYGCYWLVF